MAGLKGEGRSMPDNGTQGWDRGSGKDSPPVITFTSDFGRIDSYVAQVKGVILSGCPAAHIVDISHELAPFQVLSGAWLLHTVAAWFPAGTIHLAVVDPGVGTSRGTLVLKKAGSLFVGPDNGIFSFLYPADEVRRVDWRPETPITPTSHGRDLFAPLVVRLFEGLTLEELGPREDSPVILDITRPQVVHIDTFGNVITNIDGRALTEGTRLRVVGTEIGGVVRTFAEIPPEGLGLLCGSAGTVEVAGNRTSAAVRLAVSPGQPVELIPA